MAEFNRQLKLTVFAAYGDVCACCGEDKIEFLSIDHIDGEGKVPGHRSGYNLYRWLKKNGFPEGFRVLCMNCNFAIGHFGYCPHGKSL